MNLRPLLALTILAVLAVSCRKKDQSGNLCDGVLNESPPTTISLKFIDKTTGENLLITKDIKDNDVSVTDKLNNQEIKNWRIFKPDSTTSPLHGTLQLKVFQETEGQYPYLIQLGSIGNATLSYTISKKETGNPCKQFYFPISDIKITDRPFTLMEHQGKTVPNALVTEL